MLLRRITKHVKKQNWFAVGIDFGIVVIGVFIGIQVANWNEARNEAKLKSLVESRLIADFEIIDTELDNAISSMERQIDAMETFRQALKRGTADPSERDDILYALSYGYSYPRFLRRSATYQELQTSGRLDLIRDESFRVALSQFDFNQYHRRTNLNTIRAGVLTNGWPVGRYTTFDDIKRDENGDIGILKVVDFDFQAIESDPDYHDSVEALLANQTWIHSNVRGAREEADVVLAAIEALR